MKLDTVSRQDQIVKISLEIIKDNGIQNLTMREIAKRSGISEQAIYRHFENKLAILSSILNYFNQHLNATFLQVFNSGNTVDQIQSLIESHLQYLSENPAVAAVIFSEEIFQNESELARQVHEALKKRIDHISDLIKDGQKTGEIKNHYPPEHLAHMFLGTLRLLVTTWRLSSYSFNLQQKGELILKDLISLIKK